MRYAQVIILFHELEIGRSCDRVLSKSLNRYGTLSAKLPQTVAFEKHLSIGLKLTDDPLFLIHGDQSLFA